MKINWTFSPFGLSRLQYNEQNRGLFQKESLRSITASVQTLIEELTSVFSEKDELEYLDMSTLTAILPPLANPGSNSNVEDKLHDIWERRVCLN